MAIEQKIDFSDVQGIVRFGHGGLQAARFLLLRVKGKEAARAYLGNLPITSAETLSPPPERAVQVAMSASGLLALGLAEDTLAEFSDEFVGGMSEPSRSRRLGDVDHSSPDNWHWGGNEENCPHVLLLCYARPNGLEDWLAELQDDVFNRAFAVLAELPCSEEVSREPFGFADGVSQPHIDWDRQQTADIHRRDRYSNLLSLGEVLLGYLNEYGEYTQRPLLSREQVQKAPDLPVAEDDPQRFDLGRNGSYLVLRQLEQDVQSFWQSLDAAANGDKDRREHLAEAMVGRQRNGDPLVAINEEDLEGIDEKHRAKNNFDFDDDPRGVQCPLASHVRRSNPRTGDFPPGRMWLLTRLLRILGFDRKHRTQDLIASTRFHRILRRGRPYGPTLSTEQALANAAASDPMGLNFACLCANLARQFEFVQNAWVVNPKFAGLQDEEDPLLGSRAPLRYGTSTGNFSEPASAGPRRCLTDLKAFIRVRGGAYFFLPGIRALRFICSSSAQEGED